jgi:hypothetical protein
MSGRGVVKRKLPVKPVVALIPLAKFIEDFGFTMPQCTPCRNAKRACFVAEGSSSRCHACVRRKLPDCDVGGVSAEACASFPLFLCVYFYLTV